ncbi:SDR family oxidoreductase [Nostoc sp. UIC 10607]|uniref:SDR family oxidoreductase n=1 Tax=Nostoc sp. UIC 10607 TaxID=3045935 RepID=UPI00399F00DA
MEELINARIAKSGETKEAEIARVSATVPLSRIGTPEEFANVAVFLSSPAASFVNGVMLHVDGRVIQGTF